MATELGHDITIHVATKIAEKEETLGKTHVAIENLTRDKEIGSQQLKEEAAKNDVVTKDIRSRLPTNIKLNKEGVDQ